MTREVWRRINFRLTLQFAALVAFLAAVSAFLWSI